ncbi:transcriptional regulator, HxlR family [Sinomicrobium oceani]|uniref:Transcriptional regulator, HxlR family n=1 Tax=Sinomicrobium oceani TaxID=1150368 RepID=A0A1K1MM34_9FLAO|nr:helix-turn-helix domain-containing protein [Sinomicrobium oceani]SFW24153.1 transcriptional regulator, HxlR family [Sinomicrobium oceani]
MMNYTAFEDCGLKRSLDILSGKWKPLILYHLFHEKEIRFIRLWRKMPRVSKKVLLEQLQQMQEHRVIERIERKGFPPEVYYRLHRDTEWLGPALQMLEHWGKGR